MLLSHQSHRRLLALLVSGMIVTAVTGCPKGPQLNLSLEVTPTREQIQTTFKIKGAGFTPNQTVTLSLMREPRRTEPSRVIQTLTADGAGGFLTTYAASYPSVPIGPDPGQPSPPAFVALDNASGQSAIEETLSAYWYP